jgi:hypothetical protein
MPRTPADKVPKNFLLSILSPNLRGEFYQIRQEMANLFWGKNRTGFSAWTPGTLPSSYLKTLLFLLDSVSKLGDFVI